MVDEYSEVTTTSFGNRIIESFIEIILGLIFFLGSFLLILWNQGRSVDRIKMLDEARSIVVAISPEEMDTNNNSALIYISGKAITDDVLKDQLFGIEENALKLKRTTEVYQWEESSKTKTKNNMGGRETKEVIYSYNKIWSKRLINSFRFKKKEGHENPTSIPYESQINTASNIKVGVFKLTSDFVSQIDNFVSYPLSQKNYDAMEGGIKKFFKLNGNEYFYGDPVNPQIGAMRIKYSIIEPSEVSVIGKQNNNSVETYYTKNGDIKLLAIGSFDLTICFL